MTIGMKTRWDDKTLEEFASRAKDDTNPLTQRAKELIANKHDPVNHPQHYCTHPSGVECIQVTEWMNFNLGNAVKYIWRAGQKDTSDYAQDLKKAAWYLAREIERITK